MRFLSNYRFDNKKHKAFFLTFLFLHESLSFNLLSNIIPVYIEVLIASYDQYIIHIQMYNR